MLQNILRSSTLKNLRLANVAVQSAKVFNDFFFGDGRSKERPDINLSDINLCFGGTHPPDNWTPPSRIHENGRFRSIYLQGSFDRAPNENTPKFYAAVAKIPDLKKLSIKLFRSVDLTQAVKNVVRGNMVKYFLVTYHGPRCLEQSCSNEAAQVEEVKSLLTKNTALGSAIFVDFHFRRRSISPALNLPLMLVLLRRRAILNFYGFWAATSCDLPKLVQLLVDANDHALFAELDKEHLEYDASSDVAVQGGAATSEEEEEEEEQQSQSVNEDMSVHDIQYELLLQNPSTWCGA